MAPDSVFQPSHIHAQHPLLDTSRPVHPLGKAAAALGAAGGTGGGWGVQCLPSGEGPWGEGSSNSPGRELGRKWDADVGGV